MALVEEIGIHIFADSAALPWLDAEEGRLRVGLGPECQHRPTGEVHLNALAAGFR